MSLVTFDNTGTLSSHVCVQCCHYQRFQSMEGDFSVENPLNCSFLGSRLLGTEQQMSINNILAVAATSEWTKSKIVGKMYGFWLRAATRGVWGMCYCWPMGFGAQIPIHQLGGMVLLWDSRGYGLSKVWRGSTVYSHHSGCAQGRAQSGRVRRRFMSLPVTLNCP